MTDRTNDVLRRTMAVIVDTAPDAPELPPVHRPVRSRRPMVALASGFAAVIVTVGVVAAALTLPDASGVGSGGADLSPQDAAFAELDAAALAATECVENLGLATQPPVYQPDTATFEFTWVTGTDLQETAAESCIDTVFEPINSVWMAAYGPEPTPRLDYAAIADRLGAEPISGAELERITGLPSAAATSGYQVNQVFLDEPAAELGVIMYQDLSIDYEDEGSVYTCLHDYAEIDGVIAIGGGQCATSLESVAEIADFGIAISGACGPTPKDDPQIDGRWTLLSIWGIPSGTDTIDVEFASGSWAAVEVSDKGVAQMLWEDPEDIIAIQFDAMTPAHTDYTSELLPATAIDCTPDDGPG